MPTTHRASGSFRDPDACVFNGSGRIFRGISIRASSSFRHFINSTFFRERAGIQIVNTEEVSRDEVISTGISPKDVAAFNMWTEHDPLPFISYPYEWSFDALKSAACLTLDMLIDGLEHGYILKDASAFNVQFIQSRPIFMDVMSFEDYQDGAPFLGYKQFCEHFLAPLCLSAFSGIDFNTWFRGRLDGLDLIDVSAALPSTSYFRPNILLNIHMQAWFMRKLESGTECGKADKFARRIPKKNLIALATSLKRFIKGLQRKRTSYWQRYAESNVHGYAYGKEKTELARQFIEKSNIRRMLDLGCNTGEYSTIAIGAGADYIIGTDSDCGAIDLATSTARKNSWPAWFLYHDVANPSPNLGWQHQERTALDKRLGEMDAVFCFALIHHIAIGRNIPLQEFLAWVCNTAKTGLIEFLPKSDPMVDAMLRHRKDVFYDYSKENLERYLTNLCKTVFPHSMRSTGRTIYEFER